MSTDDDDEGCVAALVAIPFGVCIVTLGSILGGWVLTKLWAWFIVPTFSLPTLHIAAAIGLSLTFRFLVDHPPRKSKGKWSTLLANAIANTFVPPLLTLAFGWVVKFWM